MDRRSKNMIVRIILKKIRNQRPRSKLIPLHFEPFNRLERGSRNYTATLLKTPFAFSSLTHVNPTRSLSTITNFSGKDVEMTQNEPKGSNESKPMIKIVEVGPRDGLQNEIPPLVSVEDKVELIRKLERAGCSNIEVGAFVSPKWIPQMGGSSEVLRGLLAKDISHSSSKESRNDTSSTARPRYSVLIPNLKGLEQALLAGGGPTNNERGIIDEIAIFGAASEEFTKRNINATIDESMDRFGAIMDSVREIQNACNSTNDRPLLVRGYVSTVIACPYQGLIKPKEVAYAVERMLDLGCYEVSLGDTIGVGTPLSTKRMLEEVLKVASPSQIAMHCHDTYGQALVNILVGLEKEIYTIDSSVSGLGGCPYAIGASGNVATEDVLYML